MPKLRLCVISALAALGLAAVPATAAFAGGTPTPSPASPTISPQFGYNPQPQFRNWQFDLQQSDIGAIHVNDVEGFGAIPMVAWTDTQLSQTLDKFSRGGQFVVLRHPALPFPTVNLTTCTLEFNQTAPFRIVASSSGAISRNGLFVLQGLISFPYVNSKHGQQYGDQQYGKHRVQVCPLRFVSLFALLQQLRANSPNLLGLPAPTFDDFAVQGDAQVSLRNVKPTPYPTKTTYAPAIVGPTSS